MNHYKMNSTSIWRASSANTLRRAHVMPLNCRRLVRGTWVARSVKRPTLDFGSGHDLTLHELEPLIRLVRLWADSVEPTWDSPFPCLSPSLSRRPSPARACSLSVSQINKHSKSNNKYIKSLQKQNRSILVLHLLELKPNLSLK